MKDERVYLQHMLEAAEKVLQKTAGIKKEAFYLDENLTLACVHLLQIIGEGARRISPPLQARMPTIPWKEIIGFRNKIVHDYFEVDEDVTWSTIEEDLAGLVAALKEFLRHPR